MLARIHLYLTLPLRFNLVSLNWTVKVYLLNNLLFIEPNGFNAITNSSSFSAPAPVQSRQSKLNNSKSLSSEQLSFIEPNGFNTGTNPSLFNTPSSSTSFMPPNSTNNTAPANIFAQMKSGNFATDNDNNQNVNLGLHSGTFLSGCTSLHWLTLAHRAARSDPCMESRLYRLPTLTRIYMPLCHNHIII